MEKVNFPIGHSAQDSLAMVLAIKELLERRGYQAYSDDEIVTAMVGLQREIARRGGIVFGTIIDRAQEE